MGTDLVGYVASGLVLLTFTAKSMITLRILAILSNVAFVCYGVIDSIIPVLCLHTILLPVNIARLYQVLAYDKSSRPVLWQGSSADWPIAQDRWGGASKTEGREEHACRPGGRLLSLIARWRKRERHRRELATMAARDFGDIAVPPSLIREEQARWPWQAMSPGWAALSKDRYVPRNGDDDERG
jgi:uncharacterized protein YjiS (DUF1127 family)